MLAGMTDDETGGGMTDDDEEDSTEGTSVSGSEETPFLYLMVKTFVGFPLANTFKCQAGMVIGAILIKFTFY